MSIEHFVNRQKKNILKKHELNNKLTWKELATVTANNAVDLSSVSFDELLIVGANGRDVSLLVYSIYVLKRQLSDATIRINSGSMDENYPNGILVDISNQSVRMARAIYGSKDYISSSRMTIYYR